MLIGYCRSELQRSIKKWVKELRKVGKNVKKYPRVGKIVSILYYMFNSFGRDH